jgi:hypothetical protein
MGRAGGNYSNCSLSNVRVVVGTALYTSNFTIPTSNLTAITNTKLLTLQNATIVDNSTNALTFTNTGSVTTGQTYPFSAAKIFNDQSPAGNNWKPNNISGNSGSTLDYMTDVPTLTSATAANYCVLNPLMNTTGTITITNGNLTGTMGASADKMITGTMSMKGGKWYWEFTPTVVHASGDFTQGIVRDTITDNSFSNSNAVRFNTGNGWYYYGTQVSGTNTGTINAGDVIGFGLDLVNNIITIYQNGSVLSTLSGYMDLTSGYFLFVDPYYTGNAFSLNCGQQPFVYTPPSGFLALNTYNI